MRVTGFWCTCREQWHDEMAMAFGLDVPESLLGPIEGRESESPYFGWLVNSILGYPETASLKTHVHTQPVGLRPLIALEPTDHPLAVAQREGITMARVQEIVERVMHPDAKA